MLGAQGENLGVLSREKALALARPEEGLDLIEVAPNAKPPVARLMSFDKYRYTQEKAERKEHKIQKGGLKQIQISAREAKNDLMMKVHRLEEFLGEGYSVEIAMRLRGREKANKAWAEQKIKEFLAMITAEHKLIHPPKFGGNGFSAQVGKK